MDGVGIWIAFKVALIMPLSAFYAWYLTRLMQRYRIPEEKALVEAGLEPAPRARPAEIAHIGRQSPGPMERSKETQTSEREANLG
jgi:hypothetical protein